MSFFCLLDLVMAFHYLSLFGQIQFRVVVPVRVLSMGQMELFNHSTVCKQIINIELLVLDNNTWNHITVCK